MAISIGICEDQTLFKKGIVTLINSFEGMSVIVEATDGEDLLNQLKAGHAKPDILLMDLKMPRLNGIETTKILRKEYPGIKIIILTIYNEDRFILHLIECGAHAYLFKDAEPSELLKAIKAVANDGFYFTEKILSILQNHSQHKKKALTIDSIPIEISTREKEVLNLICKEHTAEEIGEILFISPRTVEGHRNRLMEKIGSKNIAGLVIFAIKNNLVELSI